MVGGGGRVCWAGQGQIKDDDLVSRTFPCTYHVNSVGILYRKYLIDIFCAHISVLCYFEIIRLIDFHCCFFSEWLNIFLGLRVILMTIRCLLTDH